MYYWIHTKREQLAFLRQFAQGPCSIMVDDGRYESQPFVAVACPYSCLVSRETHWTLNYRKPL